VTNLSARRIDALRVLEERFHREFREQEFSKLAAEARLTALRAQINPHFLFNSLTTIGYLIETAPDKAFQTLLQLTKLLRGILASTSEFSTLGDEIKLIDSYLEIERARFEKRLVVKIDIPKELEKTRIPSLILQPLVENAMKHAISENRNGGEVRIAARAGQNESGPFISLVVSDTGSGRTDRSPAKGAGVGLTSIRERLASYYGNRAAFRITIDPAAGTLAEIILPETLAAPPVVRHEISK
jgi:LytS/YehU family sensor histidine kinase